MASTAPSPRSRRSLGPAAQARGFGVLRGQRHQHAARARTRAPRGTPVRLRCRVRRRSRPPPTLSRSPAHVCTARSSCSPTPLAPRRRHDVHRPDRAARRPHRPGRRSRHASPVGRRGRARRSRPVATARPTGSLSARRPPAASSRYAVASGRTSSIRARRTVVTSPAVIAPPSLTDRVLPDEWVAGPRTNLPTSRDRAPGVVVRVSQTARRTQAGEHQAAANSTTSCAEVLVPRTRGCRRLRRHRARARTAAVVQALAEAAYTPAGRTLEAFGRAVPFDRVARGVHGGVLRWVMQLVCG